MNQIQINNVVLWKGIIVGKIADSFRKNIEFIILDIICSTGLAAAGFILSLGHVTTFESFAFSALVFLGFQVPILARRHRRGVKKLKDKHDEAITALNNKHNLIMDTMNEKHAAIITAIDDKHTAIRNSMVEKHNDIIVKMETSKKFAPKCDEQSEVVNTLASMFDSFKTVYNKYKESENKEANCPFFVRLHEAKIKALDTELKESKDGGWLRVRMEEFSKELPNMFDDNIQNYYEVATCGKGIKWFESMDATSYSTCINQKFVDNEDVKTAAKLTRILVYNGTCLDAEGEAFYALNKKQGHQVEKIKSTKISSIFKNVFPDTGKDFIIYDFAIYGRKFVWQKKRLQDGTVRANISVSNINITDYATIITQILTNCDKTSK